MKKIFSLFVLLFSGLILLVSCSNNEYDIVVTNFAGYDAARAVIKDTDKSVKMLLTPGSDAHNFDPSANDIATVLNAKVFIYVGGESDEEWVENKILVNKSDDTKIISMFEVLKDSLFEEEEHDHEGEDHDHEEEHEYDEHVWTDPTNFAKIVEAIKDAMILVDSTNKDLYEENSKSYVEKLNELDLRMKDVIDNASKNAIVVADRNPFLYFEKHYGIEVIGAFPGCSTAEAISAIKKVELINAVKDNNLDSILVIDINDSSKNTAIDIKNEINSQVDSKAYSGNKVEVRIIYAMENPIKDDFDAGKTYLDFFESNIEVIEEALN